MPPAAPRRSPDALTVLWTQEADGTDVDTGTADHFDKIFTNDPVGSGGVCVMSLDLGDGSVSGHW